jgi:hypothetical protein
MHFSVKEIDHLTSLIAGEVLSKSRDKEKAANRFSMYCRQNGVEDDVLSMPYEQALTTIQAHVKRLNERDAKIHEEIAGDAAVAPAAVKQEAIAAVATAKDALLSITADETNTFQTLGGGRWRGEKEGFVFVITREKGTSNWTATIFRDEQELASATTKGYSSCARAAVSKLNSQPAR